MPARIFVLRHGQTAENKNKIVQGQLDTALDETGLQQARETAEYFSNGAKFDVAWSSDLQRARKTAEIILDKQQESNETEPVRLRLDEDLRERHLGEAQGKHRGILKDIPGVEKDDVFCHRILRWWDTMLDDIIKEPGTGADAGKTVLVVTHGGVLNRLTEKLVKRSELRSIRWIEEGPRTKGLGKHGNCCITEYEVESDGVGTVVVTVKRAGDISHLMSEVREDNVDVQSGDGVV